jgi:hypothetical protein
MTVRSMNPSCSRGLPGQCQFTTVRIVSLGASLQVGAMRMPIFRPYSAATALKNSALNSTAQMTHALGQQASDFLDPADSMLIRLSNCLPAVVILLKSRTPDRSAFEFAHVIVTLALEYQKANTIHLVMDNLNIHSRKSLADVMAPKWPRKSGTDSRSSHAYPRELTQPGRDRNRDPRRCLGSRRIPDLKTLRRGAKAWNWRMNRDRVRIAWKFDRRAACRKVWVQKEILHAVTDLVL